MRKQISLRHIAAFTTLLGLILRGFVSRDFMILGPVGGCGLASLIGIMICYFVSTKNFVLFGVFWGIISLLATGVLARIISDAMNRIY